VSARVSGTDAVLAFADEGCGMEEEQMNCVRPVRQLQAGR
jgi:hypothetical protein